MGMNITSMLFLSERGFLGSRRNRILDIGPQNTYFLKPEALAAFVAAHGGDVTLEATRKEMDRLVYFSTPRPDERTTLLSEVTDLTKLEYASFDVCPGLRTELLDLNFDVLPERHLGYHDVVLNFGTTEHIFNQWNCFEIMHDALAVGGVFYHQLPASGYMKHGYFCYTPLFFEELAAANGYVIEEMFLSPAGVDFPKDSGLDVRSETALALPASSPMPHAEQRIPWFNIHVIMRKTRSAPFRVSLDIATAHAAAYDGVVERYAMDAHGESPAKTIKHVSRELQDLRGVVMRQERELASMTASRSWRWTAPIRRLRGLLATGR